MMNNPVHHCVGSTMGGTFWTHSEQRVRTQKSLYGELGPSKIIDGGSIGPTIDLQEVKILGQNLSHFRNLEFGRPQRNSGILNF